MIVNMMTKNSNLKQDLTTRKEQILNEFKYYDKRIEDALELNKKKNAYFFEDDSSDSDIASTINDCTSITELQLQESEFQKCLEATQELTDLHILESQVNIMVDAPSFEGESPIAEEGLWREVTAECRLDLVSFSLSFYAHRPERPFAPTSYRCLQVVLVKNIHQKELSCSVLPNLTTPSDAVEVIRSYALAHRSRRTTLAALAEKFGDCLFMEPMTEGGYVLKCANLLKISWTLQNKWSPVAPFHHKMSFDLEYLDESYIKTITNVHKKLSDPSVETDERTYCLATIIATCLEAHKNMDPDENMDTDVESQNSKRLQTSDQESDNPNRESEIMGPPKALPKKVKPKNKQNIRKRGCDNNDGGNNKRAKPDAISNSNSNCESILKSNNNNKEKFFKNNAEHINVIRNSNELKENMPQVMKKVKSNSKKNITKKSKNCSAKPEDQILCQNEANSNNVQKISSENLHDYTGNVKDSVKSSTQNNNTPDEQLNAQEMNLNYNTASEKSANETITKVVTERNSKKIEKNVLKKSKSTVTKSKTICDKEVSKTKKVRVSGGNSQRHLENLGSGTNEKNANHEDELRAEEIGREKTVNDNHTGNNTGPNNGDIFSEKEIRMCRGNSKNNEIIKTVIKEKNNEIGLMTAKPFTNKGIKKIVPKTSKIQTLSERFSSKIRTKDTIKNSNNPHSQVDNRHKSRINVGKDPHMVHLYEPLVQNATKNGPKLTLNTEVDMRIRKSKSKNELNSNNIQNNDVHKKKGNDDSSNNIQLDNYNNCENDQPKQNNYANNNKTKTKTFSNEKSKNIENNTKSHQNFEKSTSNNKTKLVSNQKSRRSLSGNKVGNNANEIKQKSKIPQKGSSVVKKMNIPLRISPRKLQSISRRDPRQTHIPRLMTKQAVKPSM